MTTYYDKRAERQVAAGIASQHEADAKARQAETALRLLDVAERRDVLADRRVWRAAERARQAHAERAQRWSARWAAVRSAGSTMLARVASVVPILVGTVAMGAPILIGWNGQLQTAREVLHLGALAWVFPVALEGGAWWLAYLTARAIRRRLPTGRLRTGTWALTLIAAGMNLWHGAVAYGLLGGAGLGLASLLGIALWEVTSWHHRQGVAGRTAADLRAVWLRRLRFPRMSWAASSIAAACGAAADREFAWRAAWIDRYGVGPEASRRDRRLARQVLRFQRRAEHDAAQRGDLVIVSGVILRKLPAAPTLTIGSASDATLPAGPGERGGKQSDASSDTTTGTASGPTPAKAARNFARLVDEAERLERQARAESAGQRGISYREAARRLRVRFDSAKEATDAARRRINGNTLSPIDPKEVA